MGTFKRLNLGEYWALWEKDAPEAIPTMCVLTIKKDEQLMPLRTKSRIVVLGNRETRDWSKSDWFAPVLRFDSLRFLVSLAVHTVVVLSKETVRMPSAKAFFLRRKSQLFVHRPVIPALGKMNIGCFKRLSMAFNLVHDTGMKRLILFCAPSVLSPTPMICASTLVLFGIHTALRRHSPLSLCQLGSMLMTLSISPKI